MPPPDFEDDYVPEGLEEDYEPEPKLVLPPGFLDAADLLAEPDPGPTSWLVEDLIVDRALTAATGRWKTTKTYGLLEIAISVRTGRPAFGTHDVAEPGPVLFVIEESGKAALWRRLDALARGRAIGREELRGLVVAPNARVKLDDEAWQHSLLGLAKRLRPRLTVFDPLARMKSSARKENAQEEMAPLIEFMREYQAETESGATIFVQHAGHAGEQMRGSSDLESVWETRLTWKKDADGAITLANEHRDAEAAPAINYRLAWDHDTRTMRLRVVVPPLREELVGWLREHSGGTTDEVREGIGRRRSEVAKELAQLKEAGTVHRGSSGRTDKLGRPIRDNVWKLTSHAGLWDVPEPGRARENGASGIVGRPPVPPSLEGDGGTSHPDGPEIERLAALATEAQQ